MTLTPEAEARIDDRIRRLSRRPRAEAGRAELRAHVADAAEGLAGSKPATPAHVDAAFAQLGSDADIRAAFFPGQARRPVSRPEIALLAFATALAAAAIAIANEGSSSCSVSGPGTCEVSATGAGLEYLVWAGPPLVVLALLVLAPSWSAVAAASLYLLLALVRTIDTATITGMSGLDLLLVAAGALASLVAVRHWRSERTAASAGSPDPASG